MRTGQTTLHTESEQDHHPARTQCRPQAHLSLTLACCSCFLFWLIAFAAILLFYRCFFRETWMQIEPVYAPQPYVPPPKVERTGPQITPLYPGLPESLSPSKRTHMAAAQPGSPQHRAMQAQQRQQQSPLRSPSSQNRFLKGQSVPRSYAYNHLPSYHTEVYDPSLPMPTVVIHKTAKDSFNKNSNMRKHRGESRNVLGGMYTS